jgi:hypothetical protein
MLKKILARIKKGMKAMFVRTKVDKWAETQIKEMAKLGGRLVL